MSKTVDDEFEETDWTLSAITDEKMRGAIGGVCVHWALLELTVERVIANLTGNSEVVTFEEDLGHRIDTLKDVARASSALSDAEKKQIVALAIEIGELKEDRHRVVHGLWAMASDGSLLSIFPRARRDSEYAPMTTAEIVEIKRDIFRAGKKLTAFVSATKAVAFASRQKQPKPVRRSRLKKK